MGEEKKGYKIMKELRMKLTDKIEATFKVEETKEGGYKTGCAFINCFWKNLDCNDCNLTKRKLQGTVVPLDAISDLIVKE